MLTLLMALVLSIGPSPANQDAGGGAKPPPVPPPLPGRELGKDATAAPIDLKPGALPAATTPSARTAWERLCRASLGPGDERLPVTAFELALDVRYRGSASQTNDFDSVYRFLAPGFVRIAIHDAEGHDKRVLLRGPTGDWLADLAREEKIQLDVGREYAEDRRQLDETVSVARTFVALTDPRSLRIASVEMLPAGPAGLPEPLAKHARELSWMCLKSPDFRLVGTGAGARLFRATLGFDPKTAWVEMALVEEDGAVGALLPSARLVEMRVPKATQGFFVPQQILVYSLEEGRTPAAFAAPAGMDLWIKRADLRAALKPEDFLINP